MKRLIEKLLTEVWAKDRNKQGMMTITSGKLSLPLLPKREREAVVIPGLSESWGFEVRGLPVEVRVEEKRGIGPM